MTLLSLFVANMRHPARMRIKLLCCLPFLIAATSPSSGVGELPSDDFGLKLPPMKSLGDDAIRFRARQWKGLNWVIQLERRSGGKASGMVSFFRPDGLLAGWLSLFLTDEDYVRLSASIDQILERDDRTPFPTNPGEFIIRADGDWYITERRRAGRTSWSETGDSGNADPNEKVRDLMLGFVERHICAYRPALSCSPR